MINITKKNILVLAPHPDDEVLGCGGIIKKFALSGNPVYVLVVTRGTPKYYSEEQIYNVRAEAKNAHSLLDVKKTIFLDFPAPELDTLSISELSNAISKIINELQIHTVYLPHRGDIHHDHTAVFNAGLVASRPVNSCSVKEIYSYECLSETEWAAPFSNDAFIPNIFVNITEQFESKQAAMRCFNSQLKEFPNPRSLETLEALSKFRGATVGFQRAEAFVLIRKIED